METLRITVIGRVQGVFFRKFTQDKAISMNLSGTIKNLRNGNVEIIVTGEENTLNSFIDEIKKGPPMSFVSKVDIEKTDYKEFKGFTISY
jgi:acylphosphatase